MFVEKKKMTSLEKMLYAVAFLILIILFIYFGKKDYTKDDYVNVSFNRDYNLVSENNYFVYVNGKTVLNLFNNEGSALVFMAFPEAKWSNNYAEIIDSAVKSTGVDEVLYYNFLSDRSNNNSTYEKLLTLLKDYVKTTDLGITDIYAPTFFIIKDGEIIYYDDETSISSGSLTPDEYWTEDKKNEKINEIALNIVKYLYG